MINQTNKILTVTETTKAHLASGSEENLCAKYFASLVRYLVSRRGVGGAMGFDGFDIGFARDGA